MITTKRNKQMFNMRNKGLTFGNIAKKFKLSAERVRQIITLQPNYCVKHSYHFLNSCPYCFLEDEYKEKLSTFSIKQMHNEAKRISKFGRKRLEIIRKKIFIQIMKDKFRYSFSGIGRLLNKHHTAIMALYY